MRRVIIKGTPPEDWVADAYAVTRQLRAATNETERARILQENESLWRDDRIRDWLLKQFANKCWYTEAKDSVSSSHVDHYRPKGRVKDLDGNASEGYWWLAFDWQNYRICGQLINVKKRDVFPLVGGVRADATGLIELRLESPVLIDPLTDETRLITYQKDEDGCMAVPASGIDEAEEDRARKTIEVLGLNRRDRLNQKRAEIWDRCRMAIDEYEGSADFQPPDLQPVALQLLRSFGRASAITRLKKMIDYNEEFSSVAEACIYTHAPRPLLASVFEHRSSS